MLPISSRLGPALIVMATLVVSSCEADHSEPTPPTPALSVRAKQSADAPSAGSSAAKPAISAGSTAQQSFGCSRLTGPPTRYSPKSDLPVGVLRVPNAWRSTPPKPVQLLVHFHSAEAVVADLDRGDTDIAVLGLEAPAGTYDKAYDGLTIKSGLAHARGALKYILKVDLSPDVFRQPNTLVLGAWSTGFAAIRRLLSETDHGVSAIVVLDGMHGVADKADRLDQLRNLIGFAQRAESDEVFFFLSHSAVPTTGFASTEESATTMLEAMYPNGVPDNASPAPPPPALPSGAASRIHHRGGLTVVGYPGSDGDAHCNQLGLYPYAIELYRSWLEHKSNGP